MRCSLDDRDFADREEQNIIFPKELNHSPWRQVGDAGTVAAVEIGTSRLRFRVEVDYSGPWPGESYHTNVSWNIGPGLPGTLVSRMDEVDVT